MTYTLSVAEAAAQLSELVQRLQASDTVVLLEQGVPVAKLVPSVPQNGLHARTELQAAWLQLSDEVLAIPGIADITDEVFAPKLRHTGEVNEDCSGHQHSDFLIEPVPPLDFPRDRKDAKFLALARAVSADYLVTGDADFTDAPAELLPHTRIVSASEFCVMMSV
jgi:antitoxin (DNA-binding transcriptional repressor) of toxin-antitoxin stability system